jgi:hypothetical protein
MPLDGFLPRFSGNLAHFFGGSRRVCAFNWSHRRHIDASIAGFGRCSVNQLSLMSDGVKSRYVSKQ